MRYSGRICDSMPNGLAPLERNISATHDTRSWGRRTKSKIRSVNPFGSLSD